MQQNQERRMPETIFVASALREDPELVRSRVTREEIIDTFNNVFSRFAVVGEILDRRYHEGGFNELTGVIGAIREGGQLSDGHRQLADDYKTYLDYRDLFFARGNINAANFVEFLEEELSRGLFLNPENMKNRQSYHNGKFREVPLIDHPLDLDLATDRFVVANTDVTNNETFAIPMGIPVRGMWRFIDREILDLKEQDSGRVSSWRRRQLRRDIETRRRERDVLFSASQPLCLEDQELHALKQHQAYLDSIDSRKSDGELYDWLNGEDVLEGRWQLNVPRRVEVKGRWALGCLPLVLPLPLLLCCALPFVGIKRDVCPAGAEPMLQVFNTGSIEEPSIEGALVARYWQLIKQEDLAKYHQFDNPELWAGTQKIRQDNTPEYQAFINSFLTDALLVKSRVMDVGDGGPLLKADDYGPRFVMATCQSFEQHFQKATEKPMGTPETWRDRLDYFKIYLPRFDFSMFPLIKVSYY